jgi:hypothetical protein
MGIQQGDVDFVAMGKVGIHLVANTTWVCLAFAASNFHVTRKVREGKCSSTGDEALYDMV